MMSHTDTNIDQTVQSNAGLTYSDLRIITGKPKRPEFSLESERLKTFSYSEFSRRHTLLSSKFAEAGFFYAIGCTRCFYCGGGLRNWHDDLNVWVEHARWFPACCFIRLKMGQDFVDTVQKLSHRLHTISLEIVLTEMAKSGQNTVPLDFRDDLLERNPVVNSVIDLGYLKEDVLALAQNILSKERHQRISELNTHIRQVVKCTVCKEKDITIVFLPCGHFICCVDCAIILADCPSCRLDIKGLVRAFLPP